MGALVSAWLVATALPAGEIELELVGVDGTPLQDAVFWAVPLDEAARKEPSGPAIMDQREKTYVPHVLPVQAGAAVTFRNSDSIGHHVYSFSPPKRFDFYLSKGESHEPIRFGESGVAAIGCNIHDWMLAYVVVVDTPWFGKTGEEGTVVLEGVPGGRYRLQAWHPRIHPEEPELHTEVAVGASGRRTWRVGLRRPLLPDRSQEPRFPDYGR